MNTHIAFLRAVNVGGTGKLPMADLKAICTKLGFKNARTYIASGNLAFESQLTAEQARKALEKQLEAYAGKPIGIIMRSIADLKLIEDANPFPDAPGNKVLVLLLDRGVESADTESVRHHTSEEIRTSKNEIYIHYPDGQGKSKLTLKQAQADGTARNMNTILKVKQLAEKP